MNKELRDKYTRRKMNIETNIKMLHSILYSKQNINEETKEYNFLSENNMKYLLDWIIDEKDVVLNYEKIMDKINEYDEKNFSFDPNSKESTYSNNSNLYSLRTRQILMEEFLFNSNVSKLLGFSANIFTLALNLFEHNYQSERRFSINKSDISKIESTYGIDHAIDLLKFLELFSFDPSIEVKNIEDYPIFKIENVYILSSLSILQENILRIYNFNIKTNEEYKKNKGEAFEKLVANIFSFYSIGNIYCNVKYNGGESDIIFEDDKSIYIIEAKAILVYDDYKRIINSSKISNNYKDLIQKTYEQCLRTKEAIEKDISLNCEEKKIKLDNTKKIYMLGVGLEDMYGYKHQKDYLFMSLESILDIFDIVNNKLYSVCNFKSGIECLKSLYQVKKIHDPMKCGIYLSTFPSGVEDALAMLNIDQISHDIKTPIISDFDLFCYKVLYCFEPECNIPQNIIQSSYILSNYMSLEQRKLRLSINLL